MVFKIPKDCAWAYIIFNSAAEMYIIKKKLGVVPHLSKVYKMGQAPDMGATPEVSAAAESQELPLSDVAPMSGVPLF